MIGSCWLFVFQQPTTVNCQLSTNNKASPGVLQWRGKAGALYEANFSVRTFFSVLAKHDDFGGSVGSAGGESAAGVF